MQHSTPGSVPPPSVRLLLSIPHFAARLLSSPLPTWKQDKPEAQAIVPPDGVVAEAASRPAEPGAEVPRAAAKDPERALFTKRILDAVSIGIRDYPIFL